MHKIVGEPRVIEYYSKSTKGVVWRYHSYELETLAVYNAVKHFCQYLHGRPFVVYTDLKSLKATSTLWHLSPRVHRWWANLQACEFKIDYRKEQSMAHVDFLSRNPLPDPRLLYVAKVTKVRVELSEITGCLRNSVEIKKFLN